MNNKEFDIFDFMYRLFYFSLFLIIPYLLGSFIVWDFKWAYEIIAVRVVFVGYALIVFVPTILLGVWTPRETDI